MDHGTDLNALDKSRKTLHERSAVWILFKPAKKALLNLEWEFKSTTTSSRPILDHLNYQVADLAEFNPKIHILPGSTFPECPNIKGVMQ